jgi:TRAP-type C4-dicarboxylate transport system permease small subunit
MERIPGRISARLAPLAKAALNTAAVGLGALTLVQGWQVFSRYVLNSAPSWSEPVSILLMGLIMMFGAAAGVHSESHFGFYIAVESAPRRLQLLMQSLSRAVVALIGGLLAYWGTLLVMDAWTIPVAGAPLPQGLLYVPLAFGGALICIFAVGSFVDGLRTAPTVEQT